MKCLILFKLRAHDRGLALSDRCVHVACRSRLGVAHACSASEHEELRWRTCHAVEKRLDVGSQVDVFIRGRGGDSGRYGRLVHKKLDTARVEN